MGPPLRQPVRQYGSRSVLEGFCGFDRAAVREDMIKLALPARIEEEG
jgi:hypothetical protein